MGQVQITRVSAYLDDFLIFMDTREVFTNNMAMNFDQHHGNGVEITPKQDQIFTQYELMDDDRCPNGACCQESIFLEESPKRMELTLIPTRES
ncbi:hypothetical protein AYI68_g2916 [Smittium mucronatum]|uniref:Uncharacterized protein n=1 Tax=Smittium mucronatum TaxID=133383 RepID=A0A1R0H1E2_9FUNG|nr:hypothetical protein AYI68_g2916 [Smittium mucronatum]